MLKFEILELQQYLLKTFVKSKLPFDIIIIFDVSCCKAKNTSFNMKSIIFKIGRPRKFWLYFTLFLYIKTGVNEINQKFKVHLCQKRILQV
jgi:hypothetical protein